MTRLRGSVRARGLSLDWRITPGAFSVPTLGVATPGGILRLSQRTSTFDHEVVAFVRRPEGVAGVMTLNREEFVQRGPDTVEHLRVLRLATAEVYGPLAVQPYDALLSILERADLIEATHANLSPFGEGSAFKQALVAEPGYGSVTLRGLNASVLPLTPIGPRRDFSCLLQASR